MIQAWNGVLPDLNLLRHIGTQVESPGAQIPMGELEPGPGKGISEGVLILMKTTGHRLHHRVMAQ